VQLVWTDDFAHWPWDREWNHGRRRQPVFGIRTPLPGYIPCGTRRQCRLYPVILKW
jgi:hypothetical protein